MRWDDDLMVMVGLRMGVIRGRSGDLEGGREGGSQGKRRGDRQQGWWEGDSGSWDATLIGNEGGQNGEGLQGGAGRGLS